MDQDRDHNDANEIDTDNVHGDADDPISELTDQPEWTDPVQDAAGNMTTAPRPGRGGEEDAEETALTLAYDAWNRLVEAKIGETTVGKYEYDPPAFRPRNYGVAGGRSERTPWVRVIAPLIFPAASRWCLGRRGTRPRRRRRGAPSGTNRPSMARGERPGACRNG